MEGTHVLHSGKRISVVTNTTRAYVTGIGTFAGTVLTDSGYFLWPQAVAELQYIMHSSWLTKAVWLFLGSLTWSLQSFTTQWDRDF